MDVKKTRKMMCFAREEATELLTQRGRVFSVRDWRGLHEIEEVEVPCVGLCERRRIQEVHDKDDLVGFLEFSGFQSLDEWWDWLEGVGFIRGFLFEVRVLELFDFARE